MSDTESECDKDSPVLCIQVLLAKSSRSSLWSWQCISTSLQHYLKPCHKTLQNGYLLYAHKLLANQGLLKENCKNKHYYNTRTKVVVHCCLNINDHIQHLNNLKYFQSVLFSNLLNIV